MTNNNPKSEEKPSEVKNEGDLRDEWYRHVIGDDAWESADIRLLAKEIADWWIAHTKRI